MIYIRDTPTSYLVAVMMAVRLLASWAPSLQTHRPQPTVTARQESDYLAVAPRCRFLHCPPWAVAGGATRPQSEFFQKVVQMLLQFNGLRT